MSLRFESIDELKHNMSTDTVAKNPLVFGQGTPDPKPTAQSYTKQANAESEKDFQKWLIGELKKNGWLAHAERPAMTKKGYVTPIQGSAGYPDITAVRAPRFLLAELKSDSGQASPSQVEWLIQMSKCPMLEVKCWSPKDRDEILEIIK